MCKLCTVTSSKILYPPDQGMVCPLSLQPSVTISIENLGSLSTTIQEKQFVAMCTFSTFMHEGHHSSNPLSISFQPGSAWISIKTMTYTIHWNLASFVIVKFYPISLRMLLVDKNDLLLPLPSHRKSMPMSIDPICHMKNHPGYDHLDVESLLQK